ncbi:olfactory receptor class A-like protein 1 [Protopterus annectens]|uniref:olfactory receptor class A-like protein 1 n=1 Tax=Protopterus annectens TaxID=7888 RepID=UPI001CF9696D|nr:olfactory receptor class A-like protein 1 [Protopterus annectens]
MGPQDILKGTIFSATTIIGLCGNTVALIFLLQVAHNEKKMMTNEVILCSLAVSNLTLLFTLGLPHSLFVFTVKYFHTDLDCQVDLYLLRVSRVMAIGLTCLLSCFQCTVLASSSHSCWTALKAWIQRYLGWIIIFLVLTSMASSINSALFPVISTNLTNLPYTFNLGYCFVIYPDKLSFELIGFVAFARDAVLVILMALASSYILFILFRHEKQMKGKRSSDRNQDKSAERQAAKTLVTLVVLYVFFFGIDNVVWFYQISKSNEINHFVTNLRLFVTFCFPSLFPFIIIFFNQKLRDKMTCSGNK